MADDQQQEFFPVEGVARSDTGKSAGLYWWHFKNLEVHGTRGDADWWKAMAIKGKTIAKIVETELRIGTRHFNKSRRQLKTLDEILRSYQFERGFFIEIKGTDKARREKFEAMEKEYGMEIIRDGSDPSRTGLYRGN